MKMCVITAMLLLVLSGQCGILAGKGKADRTTWNVTACEETPGAVCHLDQCLGSYVINYYQFAEFIALVTV